MTYLSIITLNDRQFETISPFNVIESCVLILNEKISKNFFFNLIHFISLFSTDSPNKLLYVYLKSDTLFWKIFDILKYK